MTINPMQGAHDAPRCKAKSKRTGKRCRYAAVASVECMELGVARRPASVTETIGARTKEAIQAVSLINLLSCLARKS